MLQKARTIRLAVVAGVVALAAYLLDPRSGRARRSRLWDRCGAVARRGRRRAEQQARYTGGKLTGAKARLAGAGETTPADDTVIANEVKATLAALDYPTSDVNVEVVDGAVTLRGQLKQPQQIREVRERVAAVAGVVRVLSYLHLPDTPAPNKADALDAAGASPQVVHHGA